MSDFSVPKKFGVWLIILCLLGVAGTALAFKVKDRKGTLDELAFSNPQLRVTETPANSLLSPVPLPNAQAIQSMLAELGPLWSATIDLRTGRPTLIEGGAIPWIPGPANGLSWDGFGSGCHENACIPVGTVEALARQFMARYPDVFLLDGYDLVIDRDGSGPVWSSIYLLRFQPYFKGVRLQGASVYFRINNGNLIQVAVSHVGKPAADAVPAVSVNGAWRILYGYIGGEGDDTVMENGTLEYIPMTPKGLDPEVFNGQVGGMLDYGLVWRFSFQRKGMTGLWEGVVDAHTGNLLAFRDANRYGHIHGGIRPSDGLPPEENRPFPWADTGLAAPNNYSDNAGNFPGNNATSTLTGKYSHLQDDCGAISNTTTTGDLDFLTDLAAGTDCVVPAGNTGGPGNTHSSRTLYYNTTAINLKAQIYNPTNSWLTSNFITCHVNQPAWCNATSGGGVVNFYKAAAGCNNLGEIPGVAMHEWAHSYDTNDGSGGQAPPLETYADFTAIIQTHNSCTGAGFLTSGNCGGYGNPCTACTGVRDCDYAKHNPATPWTSALNGSLYNCSAGGYNGPCGWEDHCESGISTQATWDFVYRDLPTECGMDLTSAWMLEDRLWFTGVQTLDSMYTCSGGVTTGCTGDVLYTVMRAIDDDGDGTANGTPHAHAIFHALNRHLLACGADGDATNQNQTSCPALDTPTLSAVAGNNQAILNWTTGGVNATRYFVYRNEASCDVAFTRIAVVNAPALTYTDNGVVNGTTYYYRLQAATASDSCTSPSSNCITVTPQPCAASVAYDKTLYNCNDTVNVTVLDSTPGAGPWTVQAWSTTDATVKTITLANNPPGSAMYTGTFYTVPSGAGADQVNVADGATLTVRFTDPDYCGAGIQDVDATAPVDCMGPVISNVQAVNITGNSADIIWTTNEIAHSSVTYENILPPAAFNTSVAAMVTSHLVHLTGLTECTRYYFFVQSADPAGNVTTENNGGAYFDFKTGKNVNPTYASTDVPKAIPDNTTVTSTISVPDIKAVQDVNVLVTDLAHTYDGDLLLTLIAPDGTRVVLSNHRGAGGDNFINTLFDDEASTPIASGTAPFTGSFIPDAPLSALDGKMANGTWTLEIQDTAAGDTGNLNGWSLILLFPAESCPSSEGWVALEDAVYGCSSLMDITMQDVDLLGTGTHTVDIYSTTEVIPETVTLTENPASSGVFTGSFPTTGAPPIHGDNLLSVANGDTITVLYIDADDGSGGTNVPRTDTAVAECQPPVISNVAVTNVTASSARITWTTDEAANSRVTYGTSIPPGTNQDDLITFGTSHTMDLYGLTPCSPYYFSVTSADIFANSATDTNGGSYYTFTTQGMAYAFGPDNVESGVGSWVVSGGGATPWHIDTCAANSPTQSWKVGAADAPTCAADYASTIDAYLTSPAINLGAGGFQLKFYERYQTEACCDFNHVQISTDGGLTWADLIAQYSGTSLTWTQRTISLAAYTGSVQIRFWFHTDGSVVFDGWFIDDIEVSKAQSCSADVYYQSNTWTDSCSGTGSGVGNGYLDAGEDITVHPVLMNTGSQTATGVSGTLSTGTAGITITTATAPYPDLAPGVGAACDPPHFAFRIGTGVACGTVIDFTLTITAATGGGPWTQNFSMTVGQVILGGGTLFSENFDGVTAPAIPAGWAVVDTSGTAGNWATNAGTRYPSGGGTNTSPNVAYFNSYSAANGSATRLERTGGFAIPASATATAWTFYMYHDTGYPGYTDGIQPQVSVDGGGTWVNVGAAIMRYATTNAWTQHTLSLDGYIGQADVRIAFLGTSNYGNDCHIDTVLVSYTAPGGCDMSVCTPGGCTAPAGLTNNAAVDVDACADTGVQVAWNQDVGDWGDGGTGARTYDVLRDGIPIQSGIAYGTLTYTDLTGVNGTSYAYAVRYNNGCGLSAVTAGVSASDAVGTPSAPVLSGVADASACSLGMTVTFAAGSPATQHDLYVDGVLAQADITSPYLYTPADTNPHDYKVRAVNGACFTDSNTINAADQNIPMDNPIITGAGSNTCPAVTVTLTTQSGMTNYQWLVGGLPIGGATTDTYVVTATGSYQVSFTDTNGCAGTSSPHGVIITACTSAPPPVNHMGAGAARFVKGAGEILNVSYDSSTCNASMAIVLFGNLGDWTGYAGCAQASGGNTGSTTVDGTLQNNVWYNIVWTSGTTAGHPGFATSGARTWTVGTLCGMTADDHSHITCP